MKCALTSRNRNFLHFDNGPAAAVSRNFRSFCLFPAHKRTGASRSVPGRASKGTIRAFPQVNTARLVGRGNEAGQAGDDAGVAPGRLLSRPSATLSQHESMLAVIGLLGTFVFGLQCAGKGSSAGPDPAITGAAPAFITDLSNFNARSIDVDFNAISESAPNNARTSSTTRSRARVVRPRPSPQAQEPYTVARAACGSVVASRGQSQAKRPT